MKVSEGLSRSTTETRMEPALVRQALGDLLIGATALELGYSAVTHNVRHFRMIPALEVRQL